MVGWPRKGFTIAYTDTSYALATWPGALGVLPDSPESEKNSHLMKERLQGWLAGPSFVVLEVLPVPPGQSCRLFGATLPTRHFRRV